jgi:hypothetical protein
LASFYDMRDPLLNVSSKELDVFNANEFLWSLIFNNYNLMPFCGQTMSCLLFIASTTGLVATLAPYALVL